MRRNRLTITLRKDYTDQLDSLIDGVRIRNRSHAIEYFLGKNLAARDVVVLVLAGGKGVELRPFTYEFPKVLLPVKGKPLLEYTLMRLRAANLTDVIIAVDYLGEKVEEYFGDGSKFGIRIRYIKNKKSTGTADPLKRARSIIGERTFLLHYGDVLADIDYLDLVNFHRSHEGVGTMAVTSVGDASPWGVVGMRGNRIRSFTEKPKGNANSSHLINAGVSVFNSNVFTYLKTKTNWLEEDLFPILASEGKLVGYPFEGAWFDVGNPEIYGRAVKEWKE